MRSHAVMFHHFTDARHPLTDARHPLTDARHPRGQGAIDADELARLIEGLGPRDILPARDYLRRAAVGTLRPHDLALSFDDTLACQYDVARPVLESFGLTAFFFVNTCVLDANGVETTELYRYFRTTCFASVAEFYAAFDAALESSPWHDQVAAALSDFEANGYLAAYTFYSAADRRFRFLRDDVLGPDRYHGVMRQMLARHKDVDVPAWRSKLWMTADQLCRLHAAGHVIGLHGHTHPTRMARLSRDLQRSEYAQNHARLTALLREPPTAMAHPCNSYDDRTLTVLRELGVRVGFRSDRSPGEFGPLERPRADHTDLTRRVRLAA